METADDQNTLSDQREAEPSVGVGDSAHHLGEVNPVCSAPLTNPPSEESDSSAKELPVISTPATNLPLARAEPALFAGFDFLQPFYAFPVVAHTAELDSDSSYLELPYLKPLLPMIVDQIRIEEGEAVPAPVKEIDPRELALSHVDALLSTRSSLEEDAEEIHHPEAAGKAFGILTRQNGAAADGHDEIDSALLALERLRERSDQNGEASEESASYLAGELFDEVSEGSHKEPEEGQVELDEFQSLAAEKRWDELVGLCEGRLQGNSQEDYRARLWWLKAQLEMEEVPLSILSAPLDSATHAVLAEPESAFQTLPAADQHALRSLAIELLAQAATQLEKLADYQTAITFLHRAEQVESTRAPDLLRLLEHAIADQEAIPDYRRTTTQSESLEALETLRQEVLEEQRARSKDLRGKSSEPNERNIEEADLPETTAIEDPVLEDHVLPAAANFLGESTGEASRLRSLLMFVLLCVIVTWFVRPFFVGVELDGAYSAVEVTDYPFPIPSTELSPMKRIAGLGHLEALLYDIDQSGSSENRPEPVVGAEIASVGSEPRTKTGASSRAERVPSRQIAPRKKVVVNTSAPVEPPAVRRIMATGPVEGTKRRPIGPDYVKGFPGGRDQPKGYPVYRFSPPRSYRVISTTRVLARPTYTSSVRAELKKGAKISVEEDMTIWLKIRSRRGQVGYILAQDAVPTEAGRR